MDDNRVEFLHGEITRYDHWEKKIDPDGSVRAWAGQGTAST